MNMEIKFTRSKLGTILSGVVMVILGFIIFSNPGQATLTITLTIGWVLVIMGVASLIGAFTQCNAILSSTDLYFGILELLFGFLIINWPGFFVAWIFILLGVFVMVAGINSLLGANALRVLGVSGSSAAMAGAVLAVVLGIMVMLSPFAMAGMTMVLCGVALVYAGIVRIVDGVRMPKDNKTA
jgi:uncharacterized membrane protein HdeD (DUF308 family)